MTITSFKIDNIILNYQGDHTGLGSIDLGKMSVVSMGPHYFPLGDLTRFGIYREGEDFSDVEESSTRISGWTKLIACDRSFGSGATWINFSAEKTSSDIFLQASFENGKGEDPFAFVFFVKADEIKISDKRFVKGALSSFQGMGSSVDMISGCDITVLSLQFKAPVQIIPLAGGDFFWGADFLIAFEIHDLDKKYLWALRKSV